MLVYVLNLIYRSAMLASIAEIQQIRRKNFAA